MPDENTNFGAFLYKFGTLELDVVAVYNANQLRI